MLVSACCLASRDMRVVTGGGIARADSLLVHMGVARCDVDVCYGAIRPTMWGSG